MAPAVLAPSAPQSATPSTPAAPPSPGTQPPLTEQLARPVFHLAQAGPGEHVITVQVAPETLGPVTVRAHVTAHGMHVELFASSDAGREAVRQIMPDLRRDAVATGIGTTLDLSSQNRPDPGQGRPDQTAAQQDAGSGRDTPGRPDRSTPDRTSGLEARLASAPDHTTTSTSARTAGLDVLA